ncbi:hypothetical protein ACX9R5_01190 [Rathayibacter sp. CAU 1779]
MNQEPQQGRRVKPSARTWSHVGPFLAVPGIAALFFIGAGTYSKSYSLFLIAFILFCATAAALVAWRIMLLYLTRKEFANGYTSFQSASGRRGDVARPGDSSSKVREGRTAVSVSLSSLQTDPSDRRNRNVFRALALPLTLVVAVVAFALRIIEFGIEAQGSVWTPILGAFSIVGVLFSGYWLASVVRAQVEFHRVDRAGNKALFLVAPTDQTVRNLIDWKLADAVPIRLILAVHDGQFSVWVPRRTPTLVVRIDAACSAAFAVEEAYEGFRKPAVLITFPSARGATGYAFTPHRALFPMARVSGSGVAAVYKRLKAVQ